MLTNCPKCGFSQPRDQYCARCGVDMTAYKPPDKSWWQKLSENLLVQLGIVAIIGFLAVMMITRNQKESFWTRVQFLRGSTIQVSQSQESNEFMSSDSSGEQAPDAPPVLNENATAPPASVATTAEEKTKSSGSRAKIYYLQIPHHVLAKWLEDGALTRVETSDEVTIGYIPQLNNLLEQYKAQVKVLKEENYTYNLNQLYTAKLERPLPTNAQPNGDSREAIAQNDGNSALPNSRGLPSSPSLPPASAGRSLASTQPLPPPPIMAYATLDDDRNETLSGQLEVSTNPQTSFPAQFEMSNDQSFFITGFDKLNRPSNGLETLVVLKIDK